MPSISKYRLKPVDENIHVLELFHGPTLAFKDFGARFMARVMGHFLQYKGEEVNILVATSGDTGSAVAQGFYGVPGIKVTLLYPKGKVSKIQEQQLTTVGHNVTALEVDGTFDDCQRLVKTAFLDPELNRRYALEFCQFHQHSPIDTAVILLFLCFCPAHGPTSTIGILCT